MKQLLINALCVVIVVASISCVIWGLAKGIGFLEEKYDDGIEQINLNSIHLDDSGVSVSISDAIISNMDETRKLIVTEQEASVSVELTDRIIEQLDFDFMKKTQKVSYNGTGYFVVDLDNITKQDIIEDSTNKVITIRIEHPYLQTIEVNPDNIIIDEVKEGLLARGDIELTVNDYKYIEKQIIEKMEYEFNTIENAKKADEIALEKVKQVYNPVIKAINSRYDVEVKYK